MPTQRFCGKGSSRNRRLTGARGGLRTELEQPRQERKKASGGRPVQQLRPGRAEAHYKVASDVPGGAFQGDIPMQGEGTMLRPDPKLRETRECSYATGPWMR